MASARTNCIRRLCSGASGAATASKQEVSNLRTVAKAVLVGPLGATPEVRTWASGGRSLRLVVCTGGGTTDVDEADAALEYAPRTQWNSVFVRDDVPGFNYVAKQPEGSIVYVEGQLRVTPRPEGSGCYINVNVTRNGAGMVRVIRSPSVDHDDAVQHKEAYGLPRRRK